jgi:glyoxylase-like metal-dependent hydrolase (beta-lactamase superfamily II)
LKKPEDKIIVDVLIQGYYRPGDPAGKSERACSTTALIQDREMSIISDPGSPANPGELIKQLKARGLTPGDIGLVFISHAHLDHYKQVGLFPNARVLDYWGLWEGDRCRSGVRIINEHIRVIETPGHSADSLTLLVQAGHDRFAICGDVFWEKDSPEKDPYATDPKALDRSRKKVLEWADFIIPGHGKMFSVR